jgi:choline kinase
MGGGDVADTELGPVREAVVLAAGNGDRFQSEIRESKLLRPVLGVPLLLRTLRSAREAGIVRVHVVLGYQAGRVRALVERGAPADLDARFVFNPRWREENGVSALAARDGVARRRFALLMGDHLFEPDARARLARTPARPHESLLALDTRPAPPAVAAEATKVRLEGPRITAIGKDLDPYDALDMGLFVFAPAIFDALVEAGAAGDTTLTGGVRRLAARGLMRGVAAAEPVWHDIDTLDDLAAAEARLRAQPEPA